MNNTNNNEETNVTTPIFRADGVNESERYLKKLCEHSFLTLWSYSSLYRNQGHTNKGGDGKEFCDLLVVFENHIIIFSDKYCAFKESGDLEVDWSRWYRAAIKEGAKQVWGAERWIKEYPDRLFVDKLCIQPFPITLPDMASAKFHRIIVAHGASERCKRALGGSGSLVIEIDNVGLTTQTMSKEKPPFTIGHVDVSKGFVHIFDDTTLDIVLNSLDTVSDFVAYLTEKEQCLCSKPYLHIAGEEQLAIYLMSMNGQNKHGFMFPEKIPIIGIGEGIWEKFCRSPKRIAQIERNKLSYGWDALIEEFTGHTLAGTHYRASRSAKDLEFAYRFLARENRTRRFFLMKSFYELFEKWQPNSRSVRVIMPSSPGDPYYIFMLFPHFENISEEEYRNARGNLLEYYCIVVKAKFPDAQYVVGLAVNSDTSHGVSEDLLCIDVREWSEEAQENALNIQKKFNLLNHVQHESRKNSRVS